MRNWRELKEGTLDISPELREHFLKFSERTIPPLNKNSLKIDVTLSKKIGEFQAIIDKCAGSENNNNKYDNNKTVEPKTLKSDIKKQKETLENKRITLEELSYKIKQRMEYGNEINLSDQMILDNTEKNENKTPSNNNDLNQIEIVKEEKIVPRFSAESDVVQAKDYPQRIRIPKKAWKKGATYKVDDCYYDDDGKFLYRVIGFTN